jgi:predicted transposase YdaD
MPQDIANPHDKLIKQVLGEPENAASFLAANLPAELVSHLDLSTITVVQTSFIDAQFLNPRRICSSRSRLPTGRDMCIF